MIRLVRTVDCLGKGNGVSVEMGQIQAGRFHTNQQQDGAPQGRVPDRSDARSSIDQVEAFKAQLVTVEQRQLFEYWDARCAGEALPRRADIDPIDFPRLLPSISLLEVENAGQSHVEHRVKVRLAGTRLRDMYGRETTGLYLDEFLPPENDSYWTAAFTRVISQGKPAQGVLSLDDLGQTGTFQFWLRLPLVDAEGNIAMVLGLDTLLVSEKARVAVRNTSLESLIA